MNHTDNSLLEEPVNDEAVLRFLSAQPDFFKRHPGAVAALDVTHESGAAVSLVERQLTSLRESNRRMRTQLDDMIAAAEHNQTLSERVHQLAKSLLASRGCEALAAAAGQALLGPGGADQFAIVLRAETSCDAAPGSALRHVATDDSNWQLFSNLLDERLIRCGLATDDQLRFAFGDGATQVGSSAIAPLHCGKTVGLLVMASQSESVFTRDKGHLFLEQVAALISAGIARETA